MDRLVFSGKKVSVMPLVVLTVLLISVQSCKKVDDPKNEDLIVNAEDLLNLPPEYQPGTYRHMDKLFSTRMIKRGGTVYELPKASHRLTSVKYSPDGVNEYDIDDFIARNQVAGLLIIKNGEIALEKYEQGNSETSRWTSFSVAKSVTSTLIGLAVKDGYISDLNNQVTQYLPQMAGTAYDGVSIRNLLQMSSGVYWNEDYTATSSDIGALLQAIIEERPGGILEHLSGLPRIAEPGTIFLYSTGETCLEGEVLRAALGGESLCSYLERKIWSNMGMESDAYWVLESPGGQEFAGGNISMTLRDYGRFGLFILNNGVVNGEALLPEGWVDQASHPLPDSPQCGYGMLYSEYNNYPYPMYHPAGYGYNWWLMPDTEWGAWDYLDNTDWWGEYAIAASEEKFSYLKESFNATGVFGQVIHINPHENMVAVVWSTWPEAVIDPKEYEMHCFLNAAARNLQK